MRLLDGLARRAGERSRTTGASSAVSCNSTTAASTPPPRSPDGSATTSPTPANRVITFAMSSWVRDRDANLVAGEDRDVVDRVNVGRVRHRDEQRVVANGRDRQRLVALGNLAADQLGSGHVDVEHAQST